MRETAPASAESARSRDERLLNTLPGSFLGRLLDSQGPGSARLDALNAILDSYGLDLLEAAPASDEDALAILDARGLALLTLSGADLAALRFLDHPALLMLRTELDDWRLVALRGLDENLGLLAGAVGAEQLQVPVGELELQWEGEAWVVWAPEAGVPEMLTLGDEGAGVVWLQSALADLGYYQGGASGIFDGSTRAGVMALQLDESLVPDGVAGPRTQMVLYSLLERYEVPRLTGAGEDTLGSLAGAGEDTLDAPFQGAGEEGLRVLSGSMEDLPAASERPEVEVRLSAEDGPR